MQGFFKILDNDELSLISIRRERSWKLACAVKVITRVFSSLYFISWFLGFRSYFMTESDLHFFTT